MSTARNNGSIEAMDAEHDDPFFLSTDDTHYLAKTGTPAKVAASRIPELMKAMVPKRLAIMTVTKIAVPLLTRSLV